MKKSVVITSICMLLVAGIMFFAGVKYAESRLAVQTEGEVPEVFYAEIINVRDASFEVQGLSVNDCNYRGEFQFVIQEDTELIWRGTKMELSEFEPGDIIAIQFTGGVMETSPAQLGNVVRVQLLDDEK